MRKKYIFLSFVLIAYLAGIGWLCQNYSAARWIPKTSFDLIAPKSEVENAATLQNVYPPKAEESDFYVRYDKQPLTPQTLARSWQTETAAAFLYGRKTATNALPKVAVVLYQTGLDEALFEHALEVLPPNVTLSFSPYAQDAADKIIQARQMGFEAMLDIPQTTDVVGDINFLNTLTEAELSQLFEAYYLDLMVPFVGLSDLRKAEPSATFEAFKNAHIKAKGLIYLTPQAQLSQDKITTDALNDFWCKMTAQASTKQQVVILLPFSSNVVSFVVDKMTKEDNETLAFIPASQLKGQSQ